MAGDKISLLLEVAGIRTEDHVIELGAGAGTIARCLPECKSLTLVELDERLIPILVRNVPSATVVQGDALALVRTLPFDVLIGSLPNAVTNSLFELLPDVEFRTAVLAVGEEADLSQLEREFSVSEVARISDDDFIPAQPSVSRLVRLSPRAA
jgi:16S rRNA A1518/A1519 N6-dimethyltransferase RsmA/KsgA/DIM1 with predicted DNA glycosylase/AP lyase activity